MCEFYSGKNWNVVFNVVYFAEHQVIHQVIIEEFSNLQWINPDLVDMCLLCAVFPVHYSGSRIWTE